MGAAGRISALEVKNLNEGFGEIFDISEFASISEDGRIVLQEAMKTIKELGMGTVVRVVPDSAKATANQWQRTSRTVGYAAKQAPTQAETEALLDKIEKG